MRTVLNETPPTVQDWLDRRRELGQDTFDEVWDGVYHVAPGPTPAHGNLDDQLSWFLRPRALTAGLVPHGPINVGSRNDYRVPDRSYLSSVTNNTFVPTAVIVVEIVSPNDESWSKLDFYFEHDVQEMLIVDPVDRTVQWLGRGTTGMERVAGSDLLDLSGADLHALIDWPPTAV